MNKKALLAGLAARAAPAIITRRDASFSGQLSWEDRQRLRAIVRKNMPFLFAADDSNVHVDQVIDSLGPEIARKRVLQAIAARQVD